MIKQSRKGNDFGLNQRALQLIATAVKGKSLAHGFVVAISKDNVILHCRPVLEIEKKVSHVQPEQGGSYGPYWWLREEQLIVEDDSAPF